jgi:hypothetical protein
VAAQAAAVFLQVATHLLGLAQHAARVVQKSLAGRREPNPTRFPVQQAQA